MTTPLHFRWDGEGFRPATPSLAALLDKEMVVGQVYDLEVRSERSASSHRQYFAAVGEAWGNLPDTSRFPTPEHLRKWALIKAGYRDERSFVASSNRQAIKLAAFIQPLDSYAIVTVEGRVVTTYVARSQSYYAMGKRAFEQSKEDVLDVLADMLGVTTDELAKQGNAA